MNNPRRNFSSQNSSLRIFGTAYLMAGRILLRLHLAREGAGKAGYVGQVQGGLGQQHDVPQENQMETLLPP